MASHCVSTPDLAVGASNPVGWVTTFQLLYNWKFGGNLVVDGVYGPASGAACKNIQTLFHLTPTPDTNCGPITWSCLESL